MEKNYVFNLETTKIELHFDKEEYQNMSEENKKFLKSKFLFSGKSKCWVSRAKEPNLYYAKEVAKKLGFENEERVGERLGFAEQLERKAERADERADGYDSYAENAITKAKALQKPIDDMRGDISFFTQPIIEGHAGSQAFARHRERMFDKYRKGFDEYRKSDYFVEKAKIARETRDMKKLEDKGYLQRKIDECKKNIKAREKNIVSYENVLTKIENGESVKRYNGEEYQEQELQNWIEREFELILVEIDKEGFFANTLENLGGIAFSKENVKIGYLVKIKTFGQVEVVGQGPKNITYKILDGGAKGFQGKCSYAEIKEIVRAIEKNEEVHPFKVDDTFLVSEYKRELDESTNSTVLVQAKVTYKIVKVTDKSIKLENQETKKSVTRKPRKDFRGDWYFKFDDSYNNSFYKVNEIIEAE